MIDMSIIKIDTNIDTNKNIERFLKGTIQDLTTILLKHERGKKDKQEILDSIVELLEDSLEEIDVIEIEYSLELQEKERKNA